MRLTSRQGTVEKRFEVPAARKWTVNFLSHSHQDIGYTHRQMDVMKLPVAQSGACDGPRRADEGLSRRRPLPLEYRSDVVDRWYLEAYAGTDKAARLIRAVRDGVINIDAPLGSILTGICRQEELMHMFDDAHRLAREIGVEVNTAMMSDVPGQVWGLATAMSKKRREVLHRRVPITCLSTERSATTVPRPCTSNGATGPSTGSRSRGTDKVLVWQAGRGGASWFHGWLAGRLSGAGWSRSLNYLQELETGTLTSLITPVIALHVRLWR